jgi:hypothetical protein
MGSSRSRCQSDVSFCLIPWELSEQAADYRKTPDYLPRAVDAHGIREVKVPQFSFSLLCDLCRDLRIFRGGNDAANSIRKTCRIRRLPHQHSKFRGISYPCIWHRKRGRPQSPKMPIASGTRGLHAAFCVSVRAARRTSRLIFFVPVRLPFHDPEVLPS